jgi:hypothetical protein
MEMTTKPAGLDNNLKIFKLYGRSCHIFDLSGAVCVLLVFTPALIIFFNPISAIAWLLVDAIDSTNPNATREHDALENTIKYNLFVTLPLGIWTFLVGSLYFLSKYAIISSKKRFLLHIAKGHPTSVVRENLFRLDSFYIDIRGYLCNQPARLYSRDSLARLANEPHVLEMFEDINKLFDTPYTELLADFTNKKHLSPEVIVRIMKYLKSRDLAWRLPQEPKYVSEQNISWYGMSVVNEYQSFLQQTYGLYTSEDDQCEISMTQVKDLVFGYGYFRKQKLLATLRSAKPTTLLEDDIENQRSQLRRPFLTSPTIIA